MRKAGSGEALAPPPLTLGVGSREKHEGETRLGGATDTSSESLSDGRARISGRAKVSSQCESRAARLPKRVKEPSGSRFPTSGERSEHDRKGATLRAFVKIGTRPGEAAAASLARSVGKAKPSGMRKSEATRLPKRVKESSGSRFPTPRSGAGGEVP